MPDELNRRTTDQWPKTATKTARSTVGPVPRGLWETRRLRGGGPPTDAVHRRAHPV